MEQHTKLTIDKLIWTIEISARIPSGVMGAIPSAELWPHHEYWGGFRSAANAEAAISDAANSLIDDARAWDDASHKGGVIAWGDGSHTLLAVTHIPQVKFDVCGNNIADMASNDA
jgi:hypothetical protein